MDYQKFTDKALANEALSRDEARAILQAPRGDFQKVLDAVLIVRERYHGRKVKLCVLQNTRSGLCSEDCHYCSQSAVSEAPIEKYSFLSKEELLKNADRAVQAGGKRYCMVTSGRGPSPRDIQQLSEAVREIKEKYPSLEICSSLGLLDLPQVQKLKEAGVGWINHNLNTGEQFYSKICTTHSYQDRLKTIQTVKKAGLATCCGGIFGMGESAEDFLDLAFAIRELDIDAIPLNFLHPIDGTPLEKAESLDPVRGILALCLFRFLNPKKEIRAAGGREFNLKDLQKYVIYPANSIFVEGYLTTSGQQPDEAKWMIESMGFEIE